MWRNPFGHWSTQNAILGQNWPKCPWSTLGWPKIKVSQNHPKMTFFMFLHQTWATRWFSSTLIKFDPRLTTKGTRNPNFDLTFWMGWDQFHCEDYEIPFLTTIHGSKSELKQLRYPENRATHVSTLPEAINFDSTVGISISLVFWKLDIQSFPETLRSA